MTDNKTSIRNLDKELLKQARKDAIDKGITLGAWLNRLIAKEVKGK